jgi:hypothetical protein
MAYYLKARFLPNQPELVYQTYEEFRDDLILNIFTREVVYAWACGHPLCASPWDWLGRQPDLTNETDETDVTGEAFCNFCNFEFELGRKLYNYLKTSSEAENKKLTKFLFKSHVELLLLHGPMRSKPKIKESEPGDKGPGSRAGSGPVPGRGSGPVSGSVSRPVLTSALRPGSGPVSGRGSGPASGSVSRHVPPPASRSGSGPVPGRGSGPVSGSVSRPVPTPASKT